MPEATINIPLTLQSGTDVTLADTSTLILKLDNTDSDFGDGDSSEIDLGANGAFEVKGNAIFSIEKGFYVYK